MDTAEWRNKPSPSEFLVHKSISIANGCLDVICNKGRVTRAPNFLIRTKWGESAGAREWFGIKKHKYTVIYKIDEQQGYNVQHREIYPPIFNNFKWSVIYKNIKSL